MGDERLDWGTPLFYIIWGEELREMEDSGRKEREEEKRIGKGIENGYICSLLLIVEDCRVLQ